MVGSQLVGLIPKKAMLTAAEFYIKKENLFVVEEEQKIRLVRLAFPDGLDQKPFTRWTCKS